MAANPTGGARPQAKGKGRVIPFGKYLLLERLAVGGMAEVFLAKSFGIEGFEKIIAIKRILPTMAEDEDFIEMFIDEAKIAGHLNHANIVPIYELGKIGDSHYIAMEFVWGKDLLQIMNRFRRMRKRMPPAMVAFIASRMCEALEYAHTKRDRKGTPLNLIHRDISPQNILVSYEGAVKLIDFGIAKAASRTTKTQAGVLKGKFGYMSPEQVRGLPIDHRSDIFAVGTCMYEMLTADRLFLGESDFSTLEKVRHASVAPLSELVPGLPPELEAIIMKSLSREPADRQQSAGELQEQLLEFLATQRPPFTTSKLAQWMKTAFAAELETEKARLDSYANVGRPSVLGGSAGERVTARPPAPPKPAAPPPPASAAQSLLHDDHDPFEGDLAGDATMITASPFDAMQEAEGAPEEIEGEATTIFFTADDIEEIQDEPAPRGAPNVQVFGPPGAPRPAAGPAPAPAPVPPPSLAGEAGDDRPTLIHEEGALGPPAASPQPGLAAGPPPAGASGGFALPPESTQGGLGAAATTGGPQRHKTKWIAIAGVALALIALGIGGAFLFGGDPATGTIEVRTVPDVAAEVRIDGIGRGHAPLRISEVPVGPRVVQILKEGYETVERTIEVGEGSTATVDIVLIAASAPSVATTSAAAMAPAGMGVAATVATAEETMAPTETGPRVAGGTPLPPESTMEADSTRAPTTMAATSMRTSMTVSTGMRLANGDGPMRIERIAMAPAMRVRGRGRLVVNSQPWSQVFVDGRQKGNTPLPSLRVPAGTHRVELRTSDGRVYRETVEVEPDATVRIIHRF